MKTSDLPPAPPQPLLPSAIPVICDKCRSEGMAGDAAFAGIPDLLDFEPVPRRAHVNNWTADHQRAFIAALALTGSPARAARSLGRHAFGAEQLKKAKGGRGFADAWDAAMDVAKERELARIHANLKALADDTPSPSEGEGRLRSSQGEGGSTNAGYDEDDGDDNERRHEELKDRINNRLLMARRLYLMEICDSPGKRAAFEILTELPIDWDKAAELEAQPDEPFRKPNMRTPDMLLTAENGWLGDMAYGPDKMAEARRLLDEHLASEGLPPLEWGAE